MIRVLIADDHPIVRQGLKQILAEAPDIVVKGEACNGTEALEKVRTARWDVVVLDITMPGISGLDLLKQVKSEQPKLPVLVLSMHPEEQYAVRVLRAGASGYLTKDSAPDQLMSAIRKVAKGGRYVSPSLAEQLAYDLDAGSEKPLHKNLSDREFQVLCLIASGKTVTEIAEELALSVKTISTYRARLLEKMNMTRTAQLTNYGIKNGLVS